MRLHEQLLLRLAAALELGALALVASMLGGLLNNGGAVSRVECVAYNLKQLTYDFFVVTMAFLQAGGWWGFTQARCHATLTACPT